MEQYAFDAGCSFGFGAGGAGGAGGMFRDEGLDQEVELVEALREVAWEKGASVTQVALAWARSRGNVVTLPGARRPHEVALSKADLRAIDAAAGVAGPPILLLVPNDSGR